MKRIWVYIAGWISLGLISCTQHKQTDWRMTFDRNSEAPYGCYLAYHFLSSFFPEAYIESGRNPFTDINHVAGRRHTSIRNHLTLITCLDFQADSMEWQRIQRYAEEGNIVCILSQEFSPNIYDYFHVKPATPSSRGPAYVSQDSEMHTFSLYLNHEANTYHEKGMPIDLYFQPDTGSHRSFYYMSYAGNEWQPCSIMNFTGNGLIMVCRNPMTLTNYFLLHDDHKKYLEQFMSYFPPSLKKVYWYSMKRRMPHSEADRGWSSLLQFPPLFMAFLWLCGLLLLYVLFEGKRRQRVIPVIQPPVNTSKEFVETVGRLYYNKGDHANLAEKMITHFLEQIRSQYGLNTTVLDEHFEQQVAAKTGQTPERVHTCIAFIRYIRDNRSVDETDIRFLFHQLREYRMHGTTSL